MRIRLQRTNISLASTIPRRVLHHLLLVPSDLRPPGPVHRPCRPERPAVPSSSRGSTQETEPLPREQKVRMQEAQGLQLHDSHAYSSRDGIPDRRDTPGCCYYSTYYLKQYSRDTGLSHSQCPSGFY